MKLKFALLALTLTTAAAQADWLKSVKDVAGGALKETQQSAQTALLDSAVRKALGLEEGKTTKAAVEEKIGAPASKETVEQTEVWSYDLSVLATSYPTLVELAKTQDISNKTVKLSFNADLLAKMELATPKA